MSEAKKDESELSALLCVELDNGKYTVKQDSSGRLYALRYGEEWRDLCGDNLVYQLAAEVERLRGFGYLRRITTNRRPKRSKAVQTVPQGTGSEVCYLHEATQSFSAEGRRSMHNTTVCKNKSCRFNTTQDNSMGCGANKKHYLECPDFSEVAIENQETYAITVEYGKVVVKLPHGHFTVYPGMNDKEGRTLVGFTLTKNQVYFNHPVLWEGLDGTCFEHKIVPSKPIIAKFAVFMKIN